MGERKSRPLRRRGGLSPANDRVVSPPRLCDLPASEHARTKLLVPTREVLHLVSGYSLEEDAGSSDGVPAKDPLEDARRSVPYEFRRLTGTALPVPDAGTSRPGVCAGSPTRAASCARRGSSLPRTQSTVVPDWLGLWDTCDVVPRAARGCGEASGDCQHDTDCHCEPGRSGPA